MMKISRLADYAVLICCHLARQEACLFNVNILAEQTGLGTATVSKLMKALSKAEIVTSCRGINGGYALSTTANEITLRTIVEAIDGPIALTQCLHQDGDTCSVQAKCGLSPQWHKINSAIQAAFEDVSLADMIPSIPPSEVIELKTKAAI